MSEFATYPSLRDRVVLISGGASGIGEGMVEAFARQGARVAFLDLQGDAASALVERLEPMARHAPMYLHCDVTDVPALQAAAQKVLAALGTVDVLVNNAGYDQRHRVADVTVEQWDALMQVNLRHQFFLSQAVLPAMQKQQRGSIVNLSSISWRIPSTGLPAYVTAKAGIVGLTRTLAHEVGKDNIRVNAVLPGAILTERQKRLWMTPEYTAEVMSRQAIKRHLYADDVARMVLFLAADDSGAVTNQSFVVDGGWV